MKTHLHHLCTALFPQFLSRLEREVLLSANTWIVLLLLFAGIAAAPAQDAIDLEAVCTEKKIDTSGFRVPGKDGFAWDFYRHPKAKLLPHGYNLGSNYTITLWFNLSDSAGKSALLSSFAWQKFLLMIHAGQSISLLQKGRPSMHVMHTWNLGRWYHLAVTVSPSQMSIYVDGVLLATKLCPETKKIPDSDLRVIGAYRVNPKGAVDHFFKGLIDRPILYKRVLSGDEIDAAYCDAVRTIAITPMPQQVAFKQAEKGDSKDCSVNQRIHVELNTQLLKEDDIGFQWLGEVLVDNLTFDPDESAMKLVVWDFNSEHCPERLKDNIDGPFPPEGYVLSMASEEIHLAAVTSRGLFYGLVTLTEMCKQKKQWPELVVFDYPTFSFRCGMYVNDRKPPIQLNSNLTDYVTALARYKVRYFMPRTHDWFDLDSPRTEEAIGELNALVKRHHMELIPYLQCYGHSKASLWKNIKTGHTKTIADEEYTVAESLTVLKHNHVIRTSLTEIIVKDNNGSILIEGQDYSVIDGQLRTQWNAPKGKQHRHGWAKPYICEDNEPFRIRWHNAKPGTKVFITYDIAGNTEGTCPFQKEYHDLLNSSLKRTIAIVKPSMMNLGMDEIWSPKGAGRCCSHSRLTKGQLIAYEIQRSFLAVKAISPDTDVLFFNDMLDPSQTPQWKVTDDLSWLKQGKISRDIIQVPWVYAGSSDTKHRTLAMIEWALQYGNRVIGAAGHRFPNILQWSYASLPHRSERTPGVLYTRWAASPKASASVGYQAYAQSMWSPDYLMIPAMLDVHWTLTDMGLTQESTDTEVDALIQAVKAQPSSKIMVAQLQVDLVRAQREMQLMNDRTHLDQLKSVTDSIAQAERIVEAFGR